jgi:hypothetical protein
MSHPVRPDSYIKMDNFYTVRGAPGRALIFLVLI